MLLAIWGEFSFIMHQYVYEWVQVDNTCLKHDDDIMK